MPKKRLTREKEKSVWGQQETGDEIKDVSILEDQESRQKTTKKRQRVGTYPKTKNLTIQKVEGNFVDGTDDGSETEEEPTDKEVILKKQDYVDMLKKYEIQLEAYKKAPQISDSNIKEVSMKILDIKYNIFSNDISDFDIQITKLINSNKNKDEIKKSEKEILETCNRALAFWGENQDLYKSFHPRSQDALRPIICNVFANLDYINARLERNEGVLNHVQTAINYSKNSYGQNFMKQNTFYTIAITYLECGLFEQAFKYFQETLACKEEDSENVIAIGFDANYNMGYIAMKEKNYESAVSYFEKSLAFFNQYGTNTTEATLLYKLAISRFNLCYEENFSSAANCNEIKENFKELISYHDISDLQKARCYLFLAVTNYSEGNRDTAIEQFSHACDIRPEFGDFEFSKKKMLLRLANGPIDEILSQLCEARRLEDLEHKYCGARPGSTAPDEDTMEEDSSRVLPIQAFDHTLIFDLESSSAPLPLLRTPRLEKQKTIEEIIEEAERLFDDDRFEEAKNIYEDAIQRIQLSNGQYMSSSTSKKILDLQYCLLVCEANIWHEIITGIFNTHQKEKYADLSEYCDKVLSALKDKFQQYHTFKLKEKRSLYDVISVTLIQIFNMNNKLKKSEQASSSVDLLAKYYGEFIDSEREKKMVETYNNITELYIRCKEFKKALIYIKKALPAAGESDSRSKATIFSYRGLVCLGNSDLRTALHYFNAWQNMYNRFSTRSDEKDIDMLYTWAKALCKEGSDLSKDKAEEILSEIINYDRRYEFKNIYLCYLNLAILYRLKHNERKASDLFDIAFNKGSEQFKNIEYLKRKTLIKGSNAQEALDKLFRNATKEKIVSTKQKCSPAEHGGGSSYCPKTEKAPEGHPSRGFNL